MPHIPPSAAPVSLKAVNISLLPTRIRSGTGNGEIRAGLGLLWERKAGSHRCMTLSTEEEGASIVSGNVKHRPSRRLSRSSRWISTGSRSMSVPRAGGRLQDYGGKLYHEWLTRAPFYVVFADVNIEHAKTNIDVWKTPANAAALNGFGSSRCLTCPHWCSNSMCESRMTESETILTSSSHRLSRLHFSEDFAGPRAFRLP